MLRFPALYVASLLIVVCFSCETGSSARYNYIDQQRESFVFRQPPAVIFAELQRLMAEQGHTLEGTAEQALAGVATSRRQEAGGTKEFQIRFIPLARGGLFVHIIGLSRDEGGQVTFRMRWTDLEWELIQRIEPDRAAEIMQRANKQSDEVHARRARFGC